MFENWYANVCVCMYEECLSNIPHQNPRKGKLKKKRDIHTTRIKYGSDGTEVVFTIFESEEAFLQKAS